ncbi:MAG: DUF2336 domain-containing protein [Labrys sp. (in: a-proteobacteria)]|jgi:hypothetical protein
MSGVRMLSNEILELAREPSAEKRRLLLGRITDLFFDGDSERNVSESALFEEVVLRVARDVEVIARADFSARVADEPRASRRLAMALAQDHIIVAKPVLERSPALTDDDLIKVASTMSDEHLQAITQRRTLSEIVTDVLVMRGSALVRRLAVKNTGAHFSQDGFARLIRFAEEDEGLGAGLAARADLPQEVVAELAPILSEKLRKTLTAMGIAARDPLPPSMSQTVQARLAAVFSDREREQRDVAEIVREIKAGGTTLARELPPLARADRAYDIATIVSQLAEVDHATAMKALTGPSEEPLIILFRALETPWDAFETVLTLRAKRQRQNYVPSLSLQRTYTEMDRGTAHRVLRFLQFRRVGGSAPNATGGEAA